MTDDGNMLSRQCLDRAKPATAINGIGPRQHHFAGETLEIIAGAPLEMGFAGHRKQRGGHFAVAWMGHKFGWQGHDVDASLFGGRRLIQRHDAQHGQLRLALERAQVGNGRFLSGHGVSLANGRSGTCAGDVEIMEFLTVGSRSGRQFLL